MVPFTFERATDAGAAIAAIESDPGASLIAGGTELVNWMKEGIVRPTRVIDINRIAGLDGIEAGAGGLHIGALARMADVAAHPDVRRDYPAISESLLRSASQQLRNMASMGGNLMQRTRCPFFRADAELPCNKRRPGSGCAAQDEGSSGRSLAVFGGSDACLATHPSDVAVALAALDAAVEVRAAGRERAIPLTSFHRLPGGEPERDTELERGEMIVGIRVPASAVARRSWYLKVRERTSYEFALVSVAAGIDVGDDGRLRDVRLALGGVAPRPWRLAAAERALVGVAVDDAAALRAGIEGAFAGARPRPDNEFKIELAKRAVVRTLQVAGGVA